MYACARLMRCCAKSWACLQVLLFEYAAFVSLRYSHPNTPRPFRVPGGKVGMWLCVLPQAAFALGSVIIAGWQVIVYGVACEVLILCIFYVRRRFAPPKPVVAESSTKLLETVDEAVSSA